MNLRHLKLVTTPLFLVMALVSQGLPSNLLQGEEEHQLRPPIAHNITLLTGIAQITINTLPVIPVADTHLTCPRRPTLKGVTTVSSGLSGRIHIELIFKYSNSPILDTASDSDTKMSAGSPPVGDNYVLDIQNEAAVEPTPEISILKVRSPGSYERVKENMLNRFRHDELRCRVITHIVDSEWFHKPGMSETLDNALQEELVRKRLMKKRGHPFMPFFTPDKNHYCLICPEDKKLVARRPLSLALGHARGHFEHTIDGKYTNENTKKDLERRRNSGSRIYVCPIWYDTSPPRLRLPN